MAYDPEFDYDDWSYNWMDLTGRARRQGRRAERRAARQAGGSEGVKEWRQGRWLTRRGLGRQENPYADILERELTQYATDLGEQAEDISGKLGVEAAMTGGRESSRYQEQLSDVEAERMQKLMEAESMVAGQGSAWNAADIARMRNEIAARNAQRGQNWGTALSTVGMGLSLIPGWGTAVGTGLNLLGGGIKGFGGMQGVDFAGDYERLLNEAAMYQAELDKLKGLDYYNYGGY